MDLQESLPAAHKGPENTSTPLKALNLSHETLISCTACSDATGGRKESPSVPEYQLCPWQPCPSVDLVGQRGALGSSGAQVWCCPAPLASLS